MIKREKNFFHLGTMLTNEEIKIYYDHYAMIKRKKVFFSISYDGRYDMIKRKKVFFSFRY